MALLIDEQDKDKVVFKCKHCGNDDMRFMVINSVNQQSPHYANHIYANNWDYETTPKVPIGTHIRCEKCSKDTFLIPDKYGATKWSNEVPKQCIVEIKHQVPKYSAIQYIMNGEGYLDKVVTTANGENISLITESTVTYSQDISVLGKKQYDILLERGLTEVSLQGTNKNNFKDKKGKQTK